MNLRKLILMFSSVVIMGFLASCGGSKKVAKTSPETQPKTVVTDYSELYNKNFVYKTFAGKAKMKFENSKNKQSFNANLKLQKDEKVWASIMAMGIAEVARALITPEKLQALERLNRNVYDMSFKEGVEKLNAPITFSMLENLLIGNPVMLDLKIDNITEQGSEVVLTMGKDGYTQELTYDKNLQTIKQQVIKSEAKKFECLITYTDYIVVGGQNFSKSRVLKIDDKAKGENIVLEMDFSSYDLDGVLDIQFNIPANYKKKSL